MTLLTRLIALERRRAGGGYSDAELRARFDAVAREADLDLEEFIEEVKYLLALPAAEQERLAREAGLLRAGLRRGDATIEPTYPRGASDAREDLHW